MKLQLSSKKFLIIEDHAPMRKAIREMLYFLGVQLIAETANGLGAIRAMKKEKFDIVLCDYNLGAGKNGQQILEEVKFRKLLPFHSIFIMVTAEQNQSMVLGAMESKPDEYLTKPFNALQLLTRLERNFARKEYLAEIEQALDADNLSLAIQYCESSLLKAGRKMHLHLLKLRAELAINVGDFEKASTIYRQLLEEREINWARQGLGIIAFLQSDFATAINIFQELIEKYPMMLETYDWLAKSHEAGGHYAAAQAVLDQALTLSPQAILRQQKLAFIAAKTGQFDIAEKAYKAAVSLGRNSVYKSSDDFYGLAKIYSKTRLYQASLNTLQDMRDEYFNDLETELRAATLETEVYQELGDETLSEQAYRTVQKLNLKLGNAVPNNLRLDVARACYLKGDSEIADNLIEQLIKNNVDDDRFIDDVKAMMNSTGHPPDSLIKPIKQALIEINNRGVDLFKRGRVIESMQVFEDAAASMPENKTIIINMTKILLYDLKTSGLNKGKINQIQQFLKKATALGVNPDKIGSMKIQLEKLTQPVIPDPES